MPAAQRADLGDAPGAEVGQAEIADLAGADEVAHRPDGLLQRRVRILAVQVVDVDPVGAEAAQRVLDRQHRPAPGQAALVRILAAGVAQLGGQDPAVALAA